MVNPRGMYFSIATSLVSFILATQNPNYNISDFVQFPPIEVIRKTRSNLDYNGSGIAYIVEYSATAAGLLGIIYNSAPRKRRERE